MRRIKGFTLLEILIALFIFTILSLMLMNALHNVISIQAGTEKNAQRLRELQIALLILSRDIEQSVNRPVLDTTGSEEEAFVGSAKSFSLTHLGFANALASGSSLQRVKYHWNENKLIRTTWEALDLAPSSTPKYRNLLWNVSEVSFQYLDSDKKFHSVWPVEGQNNQPLPQAVKIELTLANWGKITQIYVIPLQQQVKNTTPEAKS